MIIVRICEGLGNQLFQYSYARALRSRGLNVVLDMDKAYDLSFKKYKGHERRRNVLDNFNLKLPRLDVVKYGRYFFLRRNNPYEKAVFYMACNNMWPYRYWEEREDDRGYSPKKMIFKGRDYYVKGWFQNENYFKDIREDLLRELTPKKKIILKSELKSVISSNDSVSIHVRRGDYVRVGAALKESYYCNAIKYIREKIDNPFFLVFSDDPKWAKENLGLDQTESLYLCDCGRYQDHEELLIMSRCRSNIISNSTFSWWGAWLNSKSNKIVAAPAKWEEGLPGIIPEGWDLISE